MSSVHDILRQRLLERVGLGELPKRKADISKMSFEELWRTQWNEEFEKYMRHRLIMGGIRYGLMGSPDKPQYDRLSRVEENIVKFRETGNLEYLVDSANLLMLEYVEGNHPNRHFHSKEDVEHTKEVVE